MFSFSSSDSGIRYQSQLFMSTLERTLTLHPKVKVTLVWIPGHVGIAGNELADRMAVCGSTTSFLARRAGRLPGVPDQGGDVPVLLSRKMPTADGEGVGEEKTLPLDDSLTASEGSLFIARYVPPGPLLVPLNVRGLAYLSVRLRRLSGFPRLQLPTTWKSCLDSLANCTTILFSFRSL